MNRVRKVRGDGAPRTNYAVPANRVGDDFSIGPVCSGERQLTGVAAMETCEEK